MKDYNPYDYNNIEKCAVCGYPVGVDDFGGSDVCKHCGWQNSKHNEEWDKSMGISYPMLVPLSRAREQYKNRQPFKASFEEFIRGLFFYSEMEFTYLGTLYGVFLFTINNKEGHPDVSDDHKPKKYKIELFKANEKVLQTYDSRGDFYNKANIDGKLLKDIWDEVENPSYMWCG